MQLDQTLNLRAHIDLKIKNARRLIVTLQSAIGKLWGPNPYLTLWAYLCILRPALTFGHFFPLRETLESPLNVSHGLGHMAAARLVFEEEQLEDIEPDLCEQRVSKRKF